MVKNDIIRALGSFKYTLFNYLLVTNMEVYKISRDDFIQSYGSSEYPQGEPDAKTFIDKNYGSLIEKEMGFPEQIEPADELVVLEGAGKQDFKRILRILGYGHSVLEWPKGADYTRFKGIGDDTILPKPFSYILPFKERQRHLKIWTDGSRYVMTAHDENSPDMLFKKPAETLGYHAGTGGGDYESGTEGLYRELECLVNEFNNRGFSEMSRKNYKELKTYMKNQPHDNI
jgi:hypothetical protein